MFRHAYSGPRRSASINRTRAGRAIAVAVLAWCAAVASADTHTWTGLVSADWLTSGNWSPSQLPAAGDYVQLKQTGTDLLTLSNSATVYRLLVSDVGAGVTDKQLQLNGNTLTISELLIVGDLMNTGDPVTRFRVSGPGTLFMGTAGVSTTTAEVMIGLSSPGSTTPDLMELTGGAIFNLGGVKDLVIGEAAAGRLDVLDGSWVIHAAAMRVGFNGEGTLNINDGGNVLSGLSYVGYNKAGQVTVSDDDASWTCTGIAYIGHNSDGTLDVLNGADVTGSFNIAYNPGSTGQITVDGAGSTLGDIAYVGYHGGGTLNVTNGGRITSTSVTIAAHDDSTGDVVIDGADTAWTVSGDLQVGNFGDGTLQISNSGGPADAGGVTVAGYTRVSYDSNSSIAFDNGRLTTGALYASPDQLLGTGTINTHGLVSDIDLVFDQSQGLQRALTFDALTDQHVTLNLDVDGSAAMGAGFRADGSLAVRDGVVLASREGFLGYLNGSHGTATIDGSGSAWNILASLHVGFSNGAGTLTVSDGGSVTTYGGIIGEYIGSSGDVLITGTDSIWANTSAMDVGRGGNGTLRITDGGKVTVRQTIIANSSSSIGAVTVDGDDSAWTHTHGIYIGMNGNGSLRITNGGAVSNTFTYIGANRNSVGYALVAGDDSVWTTSGDFYVGSSGAGTLDINGGTLRVGGNMTLGQLADSSGTVNLAGGTLDMQGHNIVIGNGAHAFNFTGGTLRNFHWWNAGLNFLQTGGTLAPGYGVGEAVLFTNYTLTNGTIEVQLAGDGSPGVDWDRVYIEGSLTLQVGSTLDVKLLSGFKPEMGDRFTILSAPTLIGTFDHVNSPVFNGIYYLDAVYQDKTVLLEVFAHAIAGDANNDGIVDAADYLAIEQNFGQTGNADGTLIGDANDDGRVDGADWIMIDRHLGESLATYGIFTPEPSTLAVLLLLTPLMRRRRADAPRDA